MKYHEPFPQIEGNSNFSGTHEMMPFQCLKMMYDVLCSIDDSLDKIAGGGAVPSFGEKLNELKALKIENEEKPVKRTRARRKKPGLATGGLVTKEKPVEATKEPEKEEPKSE